MIGAFLGSLVGKVAVGIVAVLLLIIAVMAVRADAISRDREDLRNRLAAAEAHHSVTKASLNALEKDLAQMINDGAVREQRVQEALDDQRKRSAVLREEAAKIIAQGVVDECSTPGSVMNARGL